MRATSRSLHFGRPPVRLPGWLITQVGGAWSPSRLLGGDVGRAGGRGGALWRCTPARSRSRLFARVLCVEAASGPLMGPIWGGMAARRISPRGSPHPPPERGRSRPARSPPPTHSPSLTSRCPRAHHTPRRGPPPTAARPAARHRTAARWRRQRGRPASPRRADGAGHTFGRGRRRRRRGKTCSLLFPPPRGGVQNSRPGLAVGGHRSALGGPPPSPLLSTSLSTPPCGAPRARGVAA